MTLSTGGKKFILEDESIHNIPNTGQLPCYPPPPPHHRTTPMLSITTSIPQDNSRAIHHHLPPQDNSHAIHRYLSNTGQLPCYPPPSPHHRTTLMLPTIPFQPQGNSYAIQDHLLTTGQLPRYPPPPPHNRTTPTLSTTTSPP